SLELRLVQRRAQHLHRGRLVLELAALVLTRHDDAGRQVRDAYRGARLVDVLAARARGAVHVDAQVALVDVDLDRVIDDGIDEHAGERGVTPALRIERRDAHQAVHALLGLQVAVRILTGDLERRALDAGLFARLQ